MTVLPVPCTVIYNVQRTLTSGILSHLPRWPAPSYVRVDDPHLDFIKERNSTNDFEAKAHKQRYAPCVGGADAGHERLFRYAELVARVRQEQNERRVRAPLTAVRGLWREKDAERGVGKGGGIMHFPVR
jgi:hypothetical protein